MALEKELQQYMSKCMDILECMVLCYGFIIHQEASKSVRSLVFGYWMAPILWAAPITCKNTLWILETSSFTTRYKSLQ